MKNLLVLFSFLFLVACGTQPTTIHIKDQPPWYFPAVLEVEEGTTVTFDDSMAAVVHPILALSGPANLSSGHFKETWSYTFTEPGIYHYYCPVHPYMQGLIGVGMSVPKDMIPYWAQSWPPHTAQQPTPGPTPTTPGIGEVWLDAQFYPKNTSDKPGAVIVIDAETWKVKKIIDDPRLNNPHNLWLSSDGNNILQTNWFDSYLSVIDRYSGLITKHIYIGESPAHVMTSHDKIYVTLQGADGIAVLDGTTFEPVTTIRTTHGAHEHHNQASDPGTGPHGNWINANMTRMAVAHTEGASISVWDLTTHTKIFEQPSDPLPLFAGISPDGTRAWTASLLSGAFVAYDIDTGDLLKEFVVGKAPIQAVPSPDGTLITTALTGDAGVVIINATTFEPIITLKTGAGAHGVIYGPKQGGGWYAYISHKFVPWISVIDINTLTVAGHIPLPKEALGGQGILAVYN
ncbi:hypothetical protein HY641_00785 [Candidatus Woesearchaeota archaeon]|nr:hypothetical protein [Candidatus Woesearchaeota archaeon]